MKYRKAANARGELDQMAIRAEEYASYVTRKRRPPQVTLERIANIAEKVINYKHTVINRHGNVVTDNRPDREGGREAQRAKCLARVWKAYELVQKHELMHPQAQGKDESWNSAKRKEGSDKWTPDPVSFYGDVLEEIVGDELHGNTKNGITKIKSTEY
tara:strand:+ start:354 stop:827 length:474 start_codon:yes stop_codon:yes gene_type:complete